MPSGRPIIIFAMGRHLQQINLSAASHSYKEVDGCPLQ